MAELFKPPLFTALDSDGNPINGATLNFYLTGTTTATDVYTSPALSTPISQPVTADSAGRFANIYLDSAVTYKAVFKDASGSTIRTIDPVNVASSSGGATGQFISVTDFTDGVGDGTTTTNAAWTSALAQCASEGRALYVPGTADFYKITDVITVPAGVRIFGDGHGSCIKQTSEEKNVFILNGDNIEITGLNIQGTGTSRDATDFTKCNGVYASGRTNIKVNNCEIHGFQSCGVQVRDCAEWNVSDNLFYANYYLQPTGTTSSSDVLSYSGTAGARGIVANNFCLSDNSQGIYVNAQGYDSDMTITGNVCVTMTTTLSGEKAAINLNRRHGIVAGYGGGGGRFTVTGNVCRNTLVTGIYHTSNTTATHAVTIAANVCSLNGLVTAGASDATLAGGISLNGGGAQSVTLFANTIYDFRGTATDSVGGITFNGSTSANINIQILDNVVDTSTAYGICIKGDTGDVVIRGNKVFGCTNTDIILAPASSAGQQLYIEDNTCRRTINASYPSIYVVPTGGVKRNYVRRNRVIGYNSATNATTNTGIYMEGTVPFTIADNYIENFYWGVYSASSMTGRQVDTYHVDRNDFKTCTKGIRMYGGDSAFLAIACDNTFTNVTTPFDANGGYEGIFSGVRLNTGTTTRVEIYGSAAGDPTNGIVGVSGGTLRATQGTWVVGDIIHNSAGAAAGSPGWMITTAGNAAANVASKFANMI